MFNGCVCLVTQSCPTLWGPWAVACQAPLSMEFSRQEYWSGFAISYSRGSSWPRDRTGVSCISYTGSPWGCKELDTTERPTFSLFECSMCLLNECMHACCLLSRFSRVWLFATLWTAVHSLLCPCDSPGKNTGVASQVLLQGLFPMTSPSAPPLQVGWLLLSHQEAQMNECLVTLQQLHRLVSHLHGKLQTTTADHPHGILTTYLSTKDESIFERVTNWLGFGISTQPGDRDHLQMPKGSRIILWDCRGWVLKKIHTSWQFLCRLAIF